MNYNYNGLVDSEVCSRIRDKVNRLLDKAYQKGLEDGKSEGKEG